MLRLAKLVLRGRSSTRDNSDREEAAINYLDIIAKEYPDFAKNSEGYRLAAGQLKARSWSDHWKLLIDQDQVQYRIQDTIRVTVRFYNKSQEVQILEAEFLDRWQEGLHLYINQPQAKGCEERGGEIPLRAEKTTAVSQMVTLRPDEYYAARFVLGRTSLRKISGPAKLDLDSGGTYYYNLEYRHPVLTWLYLQASNSGNFRIE